MSKKIIAQEMIVVIRKDVHNKKHVVSVKMGEEILKATNKCRLLKNVTSDG